MTTASEIVDKLGRAAIASKCGVGLPSISNALARGTFPASWYAAIKSMCEAEGIECPVAVFAMKGVSDD